jgi:hypothetical protein
MANQWVQFTDQAAYITYANAACLAVGIPRPGQRQSDQATMLGNCWTTALIQPFLDHGVIVANVPTTDVPLYGLTPHIISGTQAPAGFTVFQPLPTTWLGQPVP